MTQEPRELPRKPRRGDEVVLDITGVGPRGRGVTCWDTLIGPGGQPRRLRFSVARAVPGDRVRAEVGSVRRDDVEAHARELMVASPDRVEPRCPHFGDPGGRPGTACGGCSLQSLPYEVQLATKHRQIRALFERAGLDPEVVQPIIGMAADPGPWGYRNKMEFSFGRDVDGAYSVGMHPAGRKYDVLRVEHCGLLSDEAMVLLRTVRDCCERLGLAHHDGRRATGWLRTLTIREGKRTGDRYVELTTNGDPTAEGRDGPQPAAEPAGRIAAELVEAATEHGVALTGFTWTQHHARRGERSRLEHHVLHGQETLAEELHVPGARPLRFDIHPRAFFQPNTRQAEILYGQVVEASGLARRADADARVLDLYCGTGTIGICVAPFAASVVGVELSEDAVLNARANAAANDVSNITFHAGDVGDVLAAQGLAEPGACDVAIVDPPRAGLLASAKVQLATLAAPRIVYVSCNPAALAVDAGDLQRAGWELRSVQPVDMFPHTFHIENVALFERTGTFT